MKKVLLFVYDSFAEFEIAVLVTGLSGSEYELVTFSPYGLGEPVTSAGSLKVLADLSISDVNPEEFEALIIPGGSPHPLFNNSQLIQLIRKFYDCDKLVAAICGGPGLLGAAGILDEVTYSASISSSDREYDKVMNWHKKSEAFLTEDKNVITSTGSNYLDFAEAVLRRLEVIKQDEQDPIKYFREPSST